LRGHSECAGECVNQLALLHVNHQSKVSQEIKNGLLYISNDENPW